MLVTWSRNRSKYCLGPFVDFKSFVWKVAWIRRCRSFWLNFRDFKEISLKMCRKLNLLRLVELSWNFDYWLKWTQRFERNSFWKVSLQSWVFLLWKSKCFDRFDQSFSYQRISSNDLSFVLKWKEFRLTILGIYLKKNRRNNG